MILSQRATTNSGTTDIIGKIDKLPSGTVGHLTSIISGGNLADAGYAVGDFSLSGHTHEGYSLTGHTHSYAATSHTHAISEITSLSDALSGKAASVHTHDYAASNHTHSFGIGDITGLSDALSGKAASVHTHDYAASNHTHTYGIGDITSLSDTLAAKYDEVSGLTFSVADAVQYITASGNLIITSNSENQIEFVDDGSGTNQINFIIATGTILSVTDGAVNVAGALTVDAPYNIKGGGLDETTGIEVGDGSTVITAGVKCNYRRISVASTITEWELIADTSGTVSIVVSKCSYADPATFTTLFTASLSSTAKAQATAQTYAVAAGDFLKFEITGTPTLIKRVSLNLNLSRA